MRRTRARPLGQSALNILQSRLNARAAKHVSPRAATPRRCFPRRENASRLCLDLFTRGGSVIAITKCTRSSSSEVPSLRHRNVPLSPRREVPRAHHAEIVLVARFGRSVRIRRASRDGAHTYMSCA